MALYMLDTNICIYLMRNQPKEVARRFERCGVGEVVMSAITYAELEHGVSASADPERDRASLASLIEDIPIAPFDVAAGAAYGPVRLATRDRRADHLDKLIAAHSVALGATVVTNNTRDFARYPGVVLENWLSSDS